MMGCSCDLIDSVVCKSSWVSRTWGGEGGGELERGGGGGGGGRRRGRGRGGGWGKKRRAIRLNEIRRTNSLTVVGVCVKRICSPKHFWHLVQVRSEIGRAGQFFRWLELWPLYLANSSHWIREREKKITSWRLIFLYLFLFLFLFLFIHFICIGVIESLSSPTLLFFFS